MGYLTSQIYTRIQMEILSLRALPCYVCYGAARWHNPLPLMACRAFPRACRCSRCSNPCNRSPVSWED